MNLSDAKKALDKVINKARIHFYKPFQIATILRKHRDGELDDLADLDSYKNASKKWRDQVSYLLVGRRSTSSARYQDDLFNDNACPPEAIVALGDYNKQTNGEVETYIYRMFESKAAAIAAILENITVATPSTFDLQKLVKTFEQGKGLKRSIDKVYEITVYALFSTIVRALRLEISLTVNNPNAMLLKDFESFLEKVVGLPKGSTSHVLPASLFRLGSTNASDRGLDMVANFGPAIQVKHLTLKADAIGDICEGLSADRIVIVCKDAEVSSVDAVLKQLGLNDKLQGLVTFSDLLKWYSICFNLSNRDTLGSFLLKDFIREFSEEFPSLAGFPSFMESHGYKNLVLSKQWSVEKTVAKKGGKK